MGWNDRLPEDPFVPPNDYYEEQDRYEAWLEYTIARAAEHELQLSSQNIAPKELAARQQTPWYEFFTRLLRVRTKKRSADHEVPRSARGEPAGTPE